MEEDLVKSYRGAVSMDGRTLRNIATLRDIYVLETNGQDWHPLLAFLHAGPYTVEFLVDGEQRPLPERVADLFALTELSPSSASTGSIWWCTATVLLRKA